MALDERLHAHPASRTSTPRGRHRKSACSPLGPGPSACRHSPTSRPNTSARPSTPHLSAHRAELDAIAADTDRTDLRQHHRGAGKERPRSRPGRQRVLRQGRGRHQPTSSRRSSAISRRCSRATPTRIYLNRQLYARIGDLYARRDTLGLNAEQARLLDRAITSLRPAPAARSEQGAAGPAGGDQRAPGLARHPVRPERAGRREGLGADPGRRRSRRPAGLRPRCGRRAAAEERGHPGKYAITLSRSSCEGFLQFSAAARPAREGVPRPGSSAARMAARPTTAPSSPRWWRCAANAPGCSGFATLPTTGSTTTMAKTPDGGAQAARRRAGVAPATKAAPRARRAAGR